jgi:beta-galactosidase
MMKHPLTAKTSPFSVKETADKLAAILQKRSIMLFVRINHGQAAKDSGMTLADEEVLVFGDPKVGTYLMQECPAVGVELPLRIVIWKEEQTWVGYRDPKELLEQYDLTNHRGVVEKMSAFMAALVDELVNK